MPKRRLMKSRLTNKCNPNLYTFFLLQQQIGQKNKRDDIQIPITQHPQNHFDPRERNKFTHIHMLSNFWGAHPQGSQSISKFTLPKRQSPTLSFLPANAPPISMPYNFDSKLYKTTTETTFKFPSLSTRKTTPTNLQKTVTHIHKLSNLRGDHSHGSSFAKRQSQEVRLTNSAPPMLLNILFWGRKI